MYYVLIYIWHSCCLVPPPEKHSSNENGIKKLVRLLAEEKSVNNEQWIVQERSMQNEQRIVYDILRYLSKRPSARDTFQGIAEWWILKEQIDYAIDKVSCALDFILAKGFARTIQYQDKRKYYQLNKEKLGEIKQTLKEMEEEFARQGEVW
jgi:hypothetical protein